jgi:hypothetical protein
LLRRIKFVQFFFWVGRGDVGKRAAGLKVGPSFFFVSKTNTTQHGRFFFRGEAMTNGLSRKLEMAYKRRASEVKASTDYARFLKVLRAGRNDGPAVLEQHTVYRKQQLMELDSKYPVRFAALVRQKEGPSLTPQATQAPNGTRAPQASQALEAMQIAQTKETEPERDRAAAPAHEPVVGQKRDLEDAKMAVETPEEESKEPPKKEPKTLIAPARRRFVVKKRKQEPVVDVVVTKDKLRTLTLRTFQDCSRRNGIAKSDSTLYDAIQRVLLRTGMAFMFNSSRKATQQKLMTLIGAHQSCELSHMTTTNFRHVAHKTCANCSTANANVIKIMHLRAEGDDDGVMLLFCNTCFGIFDGLHKVWWGKKVNVAGVLEAIEAGEAGGVVENYNHCVLDLTLHSALAKASVVDKEWLRDAVTKLHKSPSVSKLCAVN